jgi:hypothetical protein
MASPPAAAHLNQSANDKATPSGSLPAWTKPRANSVDRSSATGLIASVERANAPDVARVASLPSMTSKYRRSLEDLLWARTQAVAAPDIDFDSLAHASLDQWEAHRCSRSDDEVFRTYSRRLTAPGIPAAAEVLVSGTLDCSVAEAAALLRCPGEDGFTAAMTNMHGRSFQQGSVVHSFTSKGTDQRPQSDFLARYRCVKTASFARPRLALFDCDERWCFLEEFAPLRRDLSGPPNGFTLCQRSLQPDALPRAVRPPIELVRRSRGMGFKRSNKRTHQLLGLSLGYSVEAIAGSRPAAVNVVFYGCCSDTEGGDFNVVQRRIKLLARGIRKLPGLVRRRRLGAQVPADTWSIARLAASTSSRCVSCSRSVHRLLLVKKTRCYLCAHLVCSRCWICQPLDTANGRSVSVLVCPHCLHSVQHCNYAHLAASSLSGGGSDSRASTSTRISLFAGEAAFRTTEVLPDAEDAPDPGHAVVEHLEHVFDEQHGAEPSTNLSAKVQVAASVLQQLTEALDEGVNRVLMHSAWDLDAVPEAGVSSALERLHVQLEREVLPLEACVLSNAVTRAYPIDTSDGGSVGAVPAGPIPPNEAHRLEAIQREHLLLARGSDELALICDLAARELSCMASLVTVVGSSIQHVLATNFAPLQDAQLPRQHTLCQHLLMGDKPMLVQHPEADVRFCNLSLVADFGVQFYAGFPLFSGDGLSVVGSLCCFDDHYREMTQSQYSTLLHLTRTASNVIAATCSQPRSLQRLRTRGKHAGGG